MRKNALYVVGRETFTDITYSMELQTEKTVREMVVGAFYVEHITISQVQESISTENLI